MLDCVWPSLVALLRLRASLRRGAATRASAELLRALPAGEAEPFGFLLYDPPACCPGGADSNPAKFHLTKCGGGPGNQFNFTAQGQLALVGASKWSACEGLCIAPTTTSPLVSLGNCSASDPQWVRVQV